VTPEWVALPVMGNDLVIGHAAIPMASDALSPAAVHNSRSSSKRSPATFTWTRKAVPHNMVRGAMRMAARCGSSAGRASAIKVARSQLSRAAAMSRLVA